MNATLFNGMGGIITHQVGLDVTSNNLANVNTVGYKGNTAEFQSFLSNAQHTLNANSPISNGYNWGTTVGSTATNMKSGSYKASDGEFHMAYNGKGWFTVGTNKAGSFDVLNPLTNNQKNYFTRDGQFTRDTEGYLVNSEGFYLYGINLGKIGADGIFNSSKNPQDDIGALSGSKLSPIQIPKDVFYRPNVTTEMNLTFNLNRTELGASLSKAFGNIDGSVNFDSLLAQDMSALMDANSKPIDVKANKDFILTKDEKVVEKVPNPNFDPTLPPDPETNPETIEQTTIKKKEIPLVYGDSVSDEEGNVVKQGFRTIGELKALLAAEGLTLDFERTEDGTKLKGNGLTIRNAGKEDITFGISGSLATALGLKTEKTTLKPPIEGSVQDSSTELVGSAITIPTYGYSNTIYDAQGNRYSISNQFYLKQASTDGKQEVWGVKSAIMSADGKVFHSDSYTESEIKFENGKVVQSDPVLVPFAGGTISLNLTGTGDRLSTNFTGNSSGLLEEKQDGVQAGILKGVSITDQGFIMLNFTNGRQDVMGRVGLAAFVNDQGLKKVGGNLFEMDIRRTADGQLGAVSGPPLLAWSNENGGLKYGSVLHKKVELSNTDVASALTELIVFQRGYSFNAKAFTTGDELIKEAIGLKR